MEFLNYSVFINGKLKDVLNQLIKNGYYMRLFIKFMLFIDVESLCDIVGKEGDDNFKNLIGEIFDILESEDCLYVLKMCLDVGFVYVMYNMIFFF